MSAKYWRKAPQCLAIAQLSVYFSERGKTDCSIIPFVARVKFRYRSARTTLLSYTQISGNKQRLYNKLIFNTLQSTQKPQHKSYRIKKQKLCFYKVIQ